MQSGQNWKWRCCPSRYIVASERALQMACRCTDADMLTYRCNRFAFVDKSDYDQLDKMTCPFRGCNHSWCKNCQQEIMLNGPGHTCDGSSELKHLVKQMGWKHCPSTWSVG